MADRTWTFGHIIVDEAQELSAMAWRLLLRRCPSRSMTLVGDVAQTGDPRARRGATPRTLVGDRWRQAADRQLPYAARSWTWPRDAAPDQPGSRRVGARVGHRAPARDRARRGCGGGRLAAGGGRSRREGRLAVIVPDGRAAELASASRGTLSDWRRARSRTWEHRAVVLRRARPRGSSSTRVLVDPDGRQEGPARAQRSLRGADPGDAAGGSRASRAAAGRAVPAGPGAEPGRDQLAGRWPGLACRYQPARRQA